MAFSCSMPDIEATIQSEKALVTLVVSKDDDSEQIFQEHLFADSDGKICLSEVDLLLQPYAEQWLIFKLKATIKEVYDSVDGSQDSFEVSIISCKANIVAMSAESFCNTRFLTLLAGTRQTAPNFYEYLHFIGDDAATCTAYFDHGDAETFSVPKLNADEGYAMLDVSPNNFTSSVDSTKQLLRYVITAGERVQEYEVNYDYEPEIAPVLLFFNSFGVQELAYCTGEHQMVSSFDRKQTRIGRTKTSYSVEDKVTFKADTGVLTYPMANWWREVFRSKDITLMNVRNRQVVIGEGAPVVINTEKVEMSNAPDALPRFTFEYEYADRNHNVLDLRRDGRIFDNTFDYTFN